MRDPGQTCAYLLQVAVDTIEQAAIAPLPDRCMVSYGPPVWDMEQLTVHLAVAGLGRPGEAVQTVPADACYGLTQLQYVVTLIRPFPMWERDEGNEVVTFPTVEEEQPAGLNLMAEGVALWNAMLGQVREVLGGAVGHPLGNANGAAILPFTPLPPEGFFAAAQVEVTGT